MRAFVMKHVNETGIINKPIPKVGPFDVLVKTKCALVCTTDTHTVKGANGERKNLTLGHEGTGVIVEVGNNVNSVKVGQRVMTSATTPCFKCDNCQRGFTGQCNGMLGAWHLANDLDGCLAEYYLIPNADANACILPDDVADEQAVYCTDMMSTGIAGAELCDIPMGGCVVVFGCGPVGLMAIAGCRLQGAGTVIAVDAIPKRLALARTYGADHCIDINKNDVVKKISDLTSGVLCDCAIECVGSNDSFMNCINCTRPGAIITNLGAHSEGPMMNLPMYVIYITSLQHLGSRWDTA